MPKGAGTDGNAAKATESSRPAARPARRFQFLAAAGVREYHILHHKPTLRGFCRLASGGRYDPLPVGTDGVICSEVLPGLCWRLGDLERRPPMETLIEDPVYRDFVLLNLQQAQERARGTGTRTGRAVRAGTRR